MNDTILHYAAYKANEVLIKFLLSQKANVMAKNDVLLTLFINVYNTYTN